jgi:hypothetical protein
MDVVHAIKPLPSDVRKAIQKINAVRNAFAHSFFPENRKEHRKNKKVLYGGTDIRTQQGLYQSSVSLTRWGFPNQLQNDSRWRTEGRLPWGPPKTFIAAANKKEDGTLEAAAISVGRDGITPPM